MFFIHLLIKINENFICIFMKLGYLCEKDKL